MSDFQCKFYLLDGAETLECKDGNAYGKNNRLSVSRTACCRLCIMISIRGSRGFHEADRALMEFYQSRERNV